jgi:16S rRNA C967 or C1407 C5-methylase (RsmB/RsmF family)
MIPGLENLLPACELPDFQSALLRFSDRCIRVRVDRTIDHLPFGTERVPWYDKGYWLSDSSIRPGGELSFAVADYYIQDAASLLPLRLLDVQTEDRICDLCASPGGKATAIAERLGAEGVLIANEAIHSRMDVLRHNLARTGRANYATCRSDPELLELRCTDLFNKILVDVPCSGQTLVGPGKHDESAFRPQHIEHCLLRARRILGAAARMLPPGGTLVLSTCTFSVEENESQVDWLQREFPGIWEPIIVPELSRWQSPLREGCYRLWPQRDRCRGGFAAALRKIGETGRAVGLESLHENARRDHRTARKGTGHFQSRKQDHSLDLDKWLEELGTWPVGVHIRGHSANVEEPGVERLLEVLGDWKFFQSPTVAFLAGKHLEPTHALAMANATWFVPHRELALTDPAAISFMTGQSLGKSEALAVSHPDTSTVSWARGVWQNKPIGWLKESTNRWNNHLPAWARMTINVSPTVRGPA